MGCGNSKLNPGGELVPPRIRPLHVRNKLLELRKRKNGTHLRDGALSKKVLLKDGESEEENAMHVDNRHECGSTKCLASQQHTNNNNATKDEHNSASTIPPSNNNASATKTGEQSNHILEEEPQPHIQLKATHPDDTPVLELKQDKTMNEHKCIQEGDENNKKEGEDGRPDNEENRGSFICPGSPSFRLYFVEETQDDKEKVEMKDASGMGDVSHKKSPSRDSVESTTSAKCDEGQENKAIKKGKKETTFNRVVSKKRPVSVGVKNLLNVKSCYHLSCSGNDRANLLARKAEA
ncbi:probable DNA-directed RNA polymerase I subunit RPA43 isoform X1 [Cucumis sativus]|uniref:Uncharacterized protein n=1 Tax=Cucumis sativus TaxID=3659 RepID=A0A0A0LNT2_CUCSA|nr:probable DNA-directed RNA polymerase I subunit RPA43 isoform X1 [Cucumis sativus]